jgi:RsiW-degrading membrane proteinase PrsW (M82 family)
MDIQNLVSLLAPYLTNPIIILSIFLFAAVLAPIVEESFKPAVIWLLGKNLRSTGAGFALGALCGAGFATMEGLLSVSSGSQMWGFAHAGRAVASLMHIAASSILGWGIASAQLKKQFGRLVLTYLTAISIHGIWNGAAVLAVYGSLRMVTHNNQFDLVGGTCVIVGLAILLLLLIILGIGLPLINHRLRHSGGLINSTDKSQLVGEIKESSPEVSDIIAPLIL